jgi:hypothetical protein
MNLDFPFFAVVDEDNGTVYGVGETSELARHIASGRGGAYFKDPSERERTIGYWPPGPVVFPCTKRFAEYCRHLASYTSPPSYSTVGLQWKKLEQGLCLQEEAGA